MRPRMSGLPRRDFHAVTPAHTVTTQSHRHTHRTCSPAPAQVCVLLFDVAGTAGHVTVLLRYACASCMRRRDVTYIARQFSDP